MNKTTAACAVKFIDEGPGVIEGYASTFGPPADRVGDVVMPGAFGTAGYQVPFLAYHDAERPIGVAIHTPDQYGLHTRAVLAETAFAQEQRELFRVGAIPAFSIGYDFKNEANKRNDHGGWDLYMVDHMETSGVPIPANPRALVTMAKAMGMKADDPAAALLAFIKAGARNSMTDQQALNAAHEAIVKAGAACDYMEEKVAKALAGGKGALFKALMAESTDQGRRLLALTQLHEHVAAVGPGKLEVSADLLALELEDLK